MVPWPAGLIVFGFVLFWCGIYFIFVSASMSKDGRGLNLESYPTDEPPRGGAMDPVEPRWRRR